MRPRPSYHAEGFVFDKGMVRWGVGLRESFTVHFCRLPMISGGWFAMRTYRASA